MVISGFRLVSENLITIINYARYSPLPTEINHDTYESVYLRLPQTNGSYFIVGAIYRPPGQSLIQFNFQWSELLNAFNIGNKEVYLLGDYNMDLLKNETHRPSANFIDITSS